MRFETSKTPSPFLNRRLQLRMLSAVALIGVIMFVMTAIQIQNQKKQKNAAAPMGPDPSVYEVDPEKRTPLKDGEFLSPPALGEPAEQWQEPPPLEPADSESSPSPTRLATFDRSLLRRVKDNTIGIRRDESNAYFELLDFVRKAPTQALERAGATDVLYANLMDQPDRFRGEPVTIHGDLWRLYEFDAGTNPFGLSRLYEAWVITADSDTHPYRIVFTDLPPELEPGINLRLPVRVTGYFFKREGYASEGGMHVAPTLLAQRVIPFRPPGAPPRTDVLVPYMIVLVSAIGLAFLVTLVSFAISDRRAARLALQRSSQLPPPTFEGFDGPPLMTVQESLKKLEEESWQVEADRVDEPYEEVAELLAARNRAAPATPPPIPEPVRPEQRQQGIETLKSWAANQPANPSTAARRPEDAPPVPASPVSPPAPNSPDESPTSPRSKLAAWEDEIQQFANQSRDRREPTAEERAAQRAAQRDVDRDQALRDEELQDEIARQSQAEHAAQNQESAESSADEASAAAGDESEGDGASSPSGWFRRNRNDRRRHRRDGR